MRSARMLLTTAAASAVLVLGAPGAYAATGGDWDHDDSSYSKEHDNGGKHEEPRGGMHTGGGALTAVSEGDWEGGSKQGSETRKQDEGEKSWGGEHEKPRGGMHTGGGGLDEPATTAAGLAVLGVAATGLYAVRRRKSAHGVA
ncbi:hypothetical protein [Streptomyces pactum]|uniref:Gram-positive cocci surface proteins LPxTG domain-containing protein n=1 Tax=Streptomyces pactum TaxID=68249 RepID=A0A1S6JHT9_9ACTN|nr:hypothetical protein [Streptomyces pactum]AQS71323.1 hypothetical protein B1H29_34525 [Streptomyces pactum]